MGKRPAPYPEIPAQPNFPEIEARVLARWRREKTFERSVAQRPASSGGAAGDNEFVFYDGPPFANGLPHFGHLLTGYVKDVVPRYQTLRGRRVERRFGWDCHGLPAEMEAERELGVQGRAAIRAYGIEKFNDYCRASVLRYTGQWRKTVTRAGRWVDFENDYKTMGLPYMESVLWAFKTLWDKGLLYEGTRVLPYSWAAQTPLSNFETRLDDSLRARQDPAVTVRFELLPEPSQGGDPLPTELLAWTTTPWTLPSNLAVAVGPELDYALLELDGKNGKRRVILGAACVQKFAAELGAARQVGSVKGRALVGRRYRPLFPFFAELAQPAEGGPGAFRVLAADFVDVEEGTGVVHMAPGFGEEDMEICRAAGLPAPVPVDEAGRFTAEVSDYAGMLVFDANPKIIRDLRERGALLRHETIEHNYPHCWRTDEPLIYRAMNSWYLQVSRFKARMVELNRRINWIPGHVRDGLFGKWLETARDWSISRNRFWGTPIPVWKSDDPQHPRVDVYGGLDEIERDFGRRPRDLHRPHIDEFLRPNPDDPSGKSTMRRVPEVLDVWFDSGSMPFAQAHYPFENREWFEKHFPADFIVEYLAQTRGWFYTMHVLATALFDRHPFANCMCHGVALDTEGRKLSKRLRNYPEPEEVFRTHGSDALRWYLVSSPILRGSDLAVAKDGKPIADVVRGVLNPLWSAWHFFCLYANADGMRARLGGGAEGAAAEAGSHAILDRYILAKTRALVEEVAKRMDRYDLAGACQAVAAHLDALNNWFIRRSRPRFWRARNADGPEDLDKQAAYDTLGRALETLCRTASPLLPFLTDEIYKGLCGGESVHLGDWPDPQKDGLPADPQLVADMDQVREVCSAAFALRRRENVRIRQPLRALTVAGPGAARLRPFVELIRDEVNVKEVRLEADSAGIASLRLQVNARALGPRLGKMTQKIIQAAKQGRWEQDADGNVRVTGEEFGPEGLHLEKNEFDLRLEAREDNDASRQGLQALPSGEAIAALDFRLDETLLREGLARDVVRVVQQARRAAGLHVSDRIRLGLQLPDSYREAVAAFEDYVRENTLATSISSLAAPESDAVPAQCFAAELEGEPVQISVEKAAP
ncbi:MAG: isoleucine--tRNA ligase [Deltaproteobacteria bacterium]|nr:isoleucine--tRNA ligase [Deltaproteobacteria bacterium]